MAVFLQFLAELAVWLLCGGPFSDQVDRMFRSAMKVGTGADN